MKNLVIVIALLFGGSDAVFAQLGNTSITGTLGVSSSVTLNSLSGTTTINGNITLGKNASNTIKLNGVLAGALNLNFNNINNAYTANIVGINLGLPSGTGASVGASTGTIALYNASGTGFTTIQADNPNADTWTYGIPDVGNNADFVMTQGAQTINGDKTFSNTTDATAPIVASNTVEGGTGLSVTSGTVNIAGLTASAPVFTDANNNLTSTGTIPTGDLPIATAGSVGVVSVDNSTITISPSGQITAIGAAPSGVASGDLANNYPAPTIAANQSASSHIAASLNANAPAVPVNAAAGGTGNNTYAVGDILVANSTSSLGRLAAGLPGQVVGISSTGGVTYVTNGATVTNNVLSQTVSNPTQDLGVTNAAGYIRLTNNTGASLNVTGVQVSPNFANGSVVTLVNISGSSSDVIQLTNLDNTSPVTDQFDLPGGQPILLTQKGAATFIYDGSLSKWELVSTN